MNNSDNDDKSICNWYLLTPEEWESLSNDAQHRHIDLYDRAQVERFGQALSRDVNSSTCDYVLHPAYNACWITVNNISVQIVRQADGVIANLFAVEREVDDPFASCAMSFEDAQNERIDLVREALAMTNHEWNSMTDSMRSKLVNFYNERSEA